MQKLTTAFAVCLLAACGGEPQAGPAAPEVPAKPAAPQAPQPPAGRVAAARGASVYFISPHDGAEVTSPFKVVFGLSGMGVAPAGAHMDETGHHHLLIDDPEFDPAMPLPATDRIRHFGGGQTETGLELTPGEHTLQLLLGDWKHMPHDPPVMSEKITITVKEGP